MSDISIGNNSGINDGLNLKSSNDIDDLRRKCITEEQKSKKTDFANSPVMIQKQIDNYTKLLDYGKQINDEATIEWTEKKLESLKAELSKSTSSGNIQTQGYYLPANIKLSNDDTDTDTIKKVIDLFKKEKCELSENNKNAVLAFYGTNYDENSIKSFITSCMKNDGGITENMLDAIRIIASSDLSLPTMIQITQDFKKETSAGEQIIDLAMCQKVVDFKSKGMDDIPALKLVKALDSKFNNSELIQNYIEKMMGVGIAPETVIKIIDKLLVVNVQTGEKEISNSAVNSVISLKKTLSSTRNIEKDERNNPINKMGVIRIELADNNFMILKNNRVSYISPTEGETYRDAKKEYDTLIAECEDNILYDFVNEYMQKSGELNPNAIRIFTYLRRAGISYGEILKMTDACITPEDKIDTEKLDAIKKLKNSGALSSGIQNIMNSLSSENYEEDLKNACDLTASVIGDEQVSLLIPEVRNKENVREFFSYMAQFFNNKESIDNTLNLIKDYDGNVNENSMDLIYDLANNLFFPNIVKNENNLYSFKSDKINEIKFMQYASEILELAKDNNGRVSDDSAAIGAILCDKRMEPEEIISAYKACKNDDGTVNSKLSEILWKLVSADSGIDETIYILNSCKMKDLDSVLTMFDNSSDLVEIKSEILAMDNMN